LVNAGQGFLTQIEEIRTHVQRLEQVFLKYGDKKLTTLA
jgi:hypothetical protein